MTYDNFSLTLFRIVDKIPQLKNLVTRGGIKLKWAMVISTITLFIASIFTLIFSIMSSNALISANDKLCQTIAGNISSAESILTAEGKPFKRSLILQDIVTGLVKSGLKGLEYACVYDLKGKLSENERSYAAHTDGFLRARPVPEKNMNEIKDLNFSPKQYIIVTRKDKSQIPCYQYRSVFKFFTVPVGVIEIVFTEESILGELKRARIFIMLLAFVMLVFGIATSVVISRGMVRPIADLSGGMNRVRGGDLGVELSVMRHDELGELSRDFNNMIDNLREKLQMQKFVSESTISMIKNKSKDGDIALGGKRENFAFLFSDVRGFTAMSEKMQPEEVVTILNAYLDLQAQIIKKNKGDIDKFVGDEVMAVFSGKNRADNAITASVQIIEAIKKFNDERSARGQNIIQVGVGLNMGDVVHGRMGSSDRMDNTSIGDAVNLSARLCSQAEGGTIIASREIIKHASKGKFKGKKLEPIRVKGKANPIEVFQVTGLEKNQ